MDTETIVSDSRPDTEAHIKRVQELIEQAVDKLQVRAADHDLSKLREPEKSAFDRLKALSLSGMAYGSEEYRACLLAEKPAIEHHYAKNSHHPEHFPKTEYLISGMIRAQGQVTTPITKLLPEAAKALVDYADQMEAPINGMSLFDVLEMLLDWKAATERMKDGGDIRKSVDINRDRFKISPQLEAILRNTIKEMGW